MNAVGTVKFAMFEAFLNVHGIVKGLTFLIRFLDTAARRCIIMGYCEADHAAVCKVYRALHKALTERTTPNDLTTVLILNGTGNDFGSRSRVFIDKNDNLSVE